MRFIVNTVVLILILGLIGCLESKKNENLDQECRVSQDSISSARSVEKKIYSNKEGEISEKPIRTTDFEENVNCIGGNAQRRREQAILRVDTLTWNWMKKKGLDPKVILEDNPHFLFELTQKFAHIGIEKRSLARDFFNELLNFGDPEEHFFLTPCIGLHQLINNNEVEWLFADSGIQYPKEFEPCNFDDMYSETDLSGRLLWVDSLNVFINAYPLNQAHIHDFDNIFNQFGELYWALKKSPETSFKYKNLSYDLRLGFTGTDGNMGSRMVFFRHVSDSLELIGTVSPFVRSPYATLELQKVISVEKSRIIVLFKWSGGDESWEGNLFIGLLNVEQLNIEVYETTHYSGADRMDYWNTMSEDFEYDSLNHVVKVIARESYFSSLHGRSENRTRLVKATQLDTLFRGSPKKMKIGW